MDFWCARSVFIFCNVKAFTAFSHEKLAHAQIRMAKFVTLRRAFPLCSSGSYKAAVNRPRPLSPFSQTAGADYPMFNVRVFCHLQAGHILPSGYMHHPVSFLRTIRHTTHESSSTMPTRPHQECSLCTADLELYGPVGTEFLQDHLGFHITHTLAEQRKPICFWRDVQHDNDAAGKVSSTYVPL